MPGSHHRPARGLWVSDPARSPGLRLAASILAVFAAAAAIANRPAAAAEPAKIDFARDIQPILEQNCLKCHSRGKYRGGLSLETRQALVAGGESGPAATPGQSGDSLLLELITTDDAERRMPAKGAKLAAAQMVLLRRWIDQGLPWPAEIDFGFRRAALAPRRPQVPAAAPVRTWPTRSTWFCSRTMPSSMSRRAEPWTIACSPGVFIWTWWDCCPA